MVRIEYAKTELRYFTEAHGADSFDVAGKDTTLAGKDMDL